MPTELDMIRAAENILGTGEEGGSTNINFITRWYYDMYAAWCVIGISFESSHGGGFSDDGDTCNFQSRYGIGPQTTRKGWSYCGYIREAFSNAGRWGSEPRVGSFGILNGDSHIFLVVGVNDNGTIDTIECNWGDACVRVRRGTWNVMGYCYPPYDGSSSGPVGTPLLQRGSTGSSVSMLQDLLRQHGHPVEVDGDFGPATEGAVRAFQGEHGLEVDGQVGPQTWGALGVSDQVPPGPPPPPPAPIPPSGNVPMFPGYCRRGSSGDATRQVQQRLVDRGWHIGVDGDFGPQTDQTVRSYQGEKGLENDGVVGPITWTSIWTAPIT